MKFTIVNYDFNFRQEPWSRGYGRTLMLKMLWVQIPAPNTRWTFLHYFAVKIVVCLKRPKVNE